MYEIFTLYRIDEYEKDKDKDYFPFWKIFDRTAK